ncbi:YoaK family protein [Agrobacterium vitis]|uniref:YoaK family protein n=1 Tax=Agrobacterium vitis TaxID=373 RepID=UPI0012E7D750|nr:YoaK family protein [Agrobacterium vitis]MUZ65045.1 DUF1275 domain-containing protein [Agrobacterium vitis]
MLIRQGSDRDEISDRRLATSLAAVAGALNAAAFYAVGFFSANMTGNVSILSDHLAIGEWFGALLYAGIVVAFILGAACCALILQAGSRRKIEGLHAYLVLAEAALVAPLAAADAMFTAPTRVVMIVGGLAFIMGLQNAIVTHISDARVRTTHVSGMATDFGMEIALVLDAKRAGTRAETNNIRKLRLHASTMASFLLGGVVGVLVYRQVEAYLFILVSVALILISVSGLRRIWRSQP